MKSSVLLACLALAGCTDLVAPAEACVAEATAEIAEADVELMTCRGRIAEVRAAPAVKGAPDFDASRIQLIGRVVGEPVIYVEAPPPLEVPMKKGVHPLVKIKRTLRNFQRPDRRKRFLRGGYLYGDDPADAHIFVKRLTLADLFDETEIWLNRGETVHQLKRVRTKVQPYYQYEHDDGRPAKILLNDRVAIDKSELDKPLHRDLRALRERIGFERIKIEHQTENALVAKLRFGDKDVEALIDADGAKLSIGCIAGNPSERKHIADHTASTAAFRASIASLRRSVDMMIREELPFDRPFEAEDHLDDGRLRPQWDYNYKRGRNGFGVDERGYPVFDKKGRPHPPQTCVAMVLDAYERAAGTWYARADEERQRKIGKLDFDEFGIDNRQGVLAFEKFAKAHPNLFVHRRIEPRIPFGKRDAFLGYLVKHADEFRPGDIVAIQGIKRDGNIHQHAILIVDVDPITGMPFGLVDQMKKPRRRSWEGIMGEAPKRSLLYHLRPTEDLLSRLSSES